MYTDLKGKVVVITGGSKGIGRGLVEAFAKAGSKVYFTYLSSEAQAKLIEDQLLSEGWFAKAARVDGSSLEHVRDYINEIIAAEVSIDILINNAGFIPRGLFLGTTESIMDKTMNTNYKGVYNYCSVVLKYMVLKRQGVILNMTTLSSYLPAKGQSAYSASKAAIESLSKVLAIEYGKYNIRVNTIAPGLIETEIVKSISDQVKSDILSKTPLNRLGNVQDVSNAALFLASDQAKYITGVQLLITGGKHLC